MLIIKVVLQSTVIRGFSRKCVLDDISLEVQHQRSGTKVLCIAEYSYTVLWLLYLTFRAFLHSERVG